ncbi:glutathione S-transferase [Methyloprofundus sedimenti]|uniref:Glutathione S-transferase n=1 Tax=Methyloprofundus sedimenti TaxID=1420851 RepID=A0A1V8M257_9GAMM|nr:glutathione S-transferase family protein [Methyloprofundus sedimenti]OQK15625.1 glutathione S-transferase [Methyloprofundus sedimenti]
MANLKLYMTPGSCSTGIHILMEELELIFEAHIVNLPAGDQYKPDYMAINPKSTIPTLVTKEGTAITEFSAIAYWLARTYPKAQLMPGDIEGDTLVLETMNYVVNTLHMQGFTRIFTTDNYAFNEADVDRVKAQGDIIVKKGFALINKQLEGKSFISNKFSIADAALFYCEFWAVRIGIHLPDNCLAHYHTILKRPAAIQVLKEEGYSSLFQ